MAILSRECIQEVGSTFKSFSNLVKESALLTAFRWSINWFTRRKGESWMRPFTKIHTPSLSSKYNNFFPAIIAVAEKIIFLCHCYLHRVILSEELFFSDQKAAFWGSILRNLRFCKSRIPRIFDDTGWKHLYRSHSHKTNNKAPHITR